MLKIRLRRIGRKHDPHYQIVVSEARFPRNGKFVERIGYENPRRNPKVLEVDKEKAKKWLSVGAQPTETVEQLFVKVGILKSIKKGSTPPKKKTKKKKEEE